MRKLPMLIGMFGLVLNTYAQRASFEKINGERGLSKQFLKLSEGEQVPFNPGKARQIFGFNATTDLVLMGKETDGAGFTHYRYYQTYNNIPVENTMFLVHIKVNKLISMGGGIVTRFAPAMPKGTAPSLSPAQAIKAALNYVHAQKYAWQDPFFEQRIKVRKGSTATYYPVPAKVWYGGDDIDVSNLKLAYKIDVYTLKPFDRKFVYVDAKTGKILGTRQQMMHSDATGTAATGYSGTQTIHSELKGTTYRLRDLTKGDGVITLHASGTHADYTSTSPNWAFSNADKWALDAHYGVAATWTFYKNVFNRNSVDNQGFALISWVNDASNIDNADWDGSEMDYGNLSSNGNGVTAIDVTGHELTHGVTQFTSNLVYSKEPGAINESMSDIMGKSVQFYTKPGDKSWVLSNDMDWELRNFSNPKAEGQPDTYKGTNWASTATSNDYGGVHTNSGVGNYMFYLLVEGGSGTNDNGNAYNVSGIGLSKADQIIYRTETVYLTSTSQYADWRTACINAATDLYGAGSNEVIQVENAWYAVGIGTNGGSSCNLPAPAGLSAGSITDTGATISWSAVKDAAGYILQWKPASATTFNTVTGITSPSYNLKASNSGTSYVVQVSSVCSNGGNGGYSAPVSFKTTGPAPLVYCTSVGKTLDGITNVTFNTINNSTSATSSGYTDYTATQSTTVSRGNPYTLSAKINTGGNFTNYTKAWIDWNHDGVFSTGTEEYNLGTAKNVSNGSTSVSPLSLTVPAAAVTGTTRMRVSTRFSAAPSPCAALFDGEVEDYSVIVIATGPVCSTPSGLSASGVTNTGATFNWSAVSGATGYTVQYRVTGTTIWTTVSSATTSLNVSGLAAGISYEFQVATVCSASITSPYTSPVTFTTTGGIIAYCASKGTTTYEYLKTVVLGTINHTVTNDGGYEDYTGLSASLVAGTTYAIKLTPGFTSSSYTENYNVYIDYNGDGVLNGTGEIVATGNGAGTGTKSLSFKVPATVKNGNARLRVQMQYGTINTNPCATSFYGDVHDYTVNITGGSGLDAQGFSDNSSSNDNAIQVFPNPTTGAPATLSYHLSAAGQVTLRVLDIFGRKIQSIDLGKQKPGSYTYPINHTKELIDGNYFVAVYQNNKLIGRKKIILLSK